MADPEDNHRDTMRTAVLRACDSYDITIHDFDDLEIAQIDDDTHEARVPVSGRVMFEDLVESQGPLLYLMDDVEVTLKGVADDRLLLGVSLKES